MTGDTFCDLCGGVTSYTRGSGTLWDEPDNLCTCGGVAKLKAERDELKAENEKYQQALRWYRDHVADRAGADLLDAIWLEPDEKQTEFIKEHTK